MRGLGDAFWKQQRRKPTKAQVDSYLQKARALDDETRKAHLQLAGAAGRARLGDEQKQHLRRVMQLGGKLEFARNGKAKLDGAKKHGTKVLTESELEALLEGGSA